MITTFIVSTNSDTGVGSLRWAIEQANAAGEAAIRFDPAVTLIEPYTPLPPVTFSGTIGDEGQSIKISGEFADEPYPNADVLPLAVGLVIASRDMQIRGLTFTEWGDGNEAVSAA